MEVTGEEKAFIGALDACECYLESAERLSSALQQGYFSLVQAKYSMGSEKISPSQYDYSVEASCRVTPDQRQENQHSFRLLESSTAPQSSGSVPEEERHESKASATGSSCSSTEKPHNPMFDTSEVAPPSTSSQSAQSTQQVPGAEGAGEYSSLISELAEKFGCDETLQYGRSDMHYSPRKREPLSWFCGGLVSPHLRASQRHFQEAVELAIKMVNARGILADRLDKAATATSAS